MALAAFAERDPEWVQNEVLGCLSVIERRHRLPRVFEPIDDMTEETSDPANDIEVYDLGAWTVVTAPGGLHAQFIEVARRVADHLDTLAVIAANHPAGWDLHVYQGIVLLDRRTPQESGTPGSLARRFGVTEASIEPAYRDPSPDAMLALWNGLALPRPSGKPVRILRNAASTLCYGL